ncbi:hypothetical protein BDZ97DRAFT_1762884 [Flammula alnicola]|nr:hypothetical protein BDZ97DRAFT_1762884 [Flammula alnicola]
MTPTQFQALAPSISNVTAASLRSATRKKLRAEQRDELEAFLLDSPLGRQAKLLICLLSVENKVDSFQSAAPPFQVSEELKTNISNYALAVLLSVKISAYKGNIPHNHILNIISKYRFDLPPRIEHDYASWEKIKTQVSYALTQLRSKIKKIRKVHRECGGSERYWNLIDDRLEFIRKTADSSVSKVTKAFNAILKADRQLYGADEDYEIKDTLPDEFQQRVDDVVSGNVVPE